MPADPWNVSTVSLVNALRQQPSISDIPNSALKYTVIDDTNVVYRGVQELAELHSIDEKIPPKDYVCYRPERIALHQSIIAVTTQLKLSNESDMQRLSQSIYTDVLTDLGSLHLDTLRKNIEENVRSLVDRYLSNEDISKKLDGEKIKSICDVVEKSHVNFGEFKIGYTKRDAMIARATDIIFSEQATDMIIPLVNQKILASQAKALDIPVADQRLMLMVTGGQASGKGSSVQRLEVLATDSGVAWDNIVKINTDSYKSLLLKQGSVDPLLYSQLAHEEASTVNQGIQKCLSNMADLGKSPHIFVDQVFVGAAQIDLGLKNGGKVRGFIVSTDVEDAIVRSYNRGLKEGDTGRYESSKGILSTHKMMAEQVPSTLAKYSGQDVKFVLVDNNVKPSEQATDVMSFDLKAKNLQVYSKTKLDRFILKTNINTTAINSNEVYNKTQPLSRIDYLEPLKIAGVNLNEENPLLSSSKDYKQSVASIIPDEKQVNTDTLVDDHNNENNQGENCGPKTPNRR